MQTAIDLLVEATSYILLSGNIYQSGAQGWMRDEAVLGGNLVRMYKLGDAILDQTVKHRRETSFILSRLHFETAINTIYLMDRSSPDLFERFIRHAFEYEKRLHARISRNIEARGDGSMPIEERMLSSIARMCERSGVSLDDLDGKRTLDWEGKGRNFFERTKDVGFEDAYVLVFANSSASIHGSWGDLYANHLEYREGRFFAQTSFMPPRPQYLEVLSLTSSTVVKRFIEYLGLYQERRPLHEILDTHMEKVLRFTRLHEDFLSRT